MDKPKRSVWNYRPDLPITNSPVFVWPPRPGAALRRLTHRWVDITSDGMFLLVSLALLHWIIPDLETMRALQLHWIATIWLSNIAIMTVIAGGLHLWFLTFTMQGQQMKFDVRQMMTDNGSFTFRDQVRDNMFWTYASGVTAWTFFEVLYFWCAANGWVNVLSFREAPIWFFVSLLLTPVFSSMHFYWIHRLLHWPPLYRRVHSLHHRNVNIGPWSGMSMHPVESFMYVSAVLIHFVVPSHLLVFMAHLLTKSVGPAFSHAGFEKVMFRNGEDIEAGDFHHQLHHRYFECNYGTTEMPWDAWFGTFHDGTEEATAPIKERRKRLQTR